MADLRIDLAAEFKGKKAFKEADSAVVNLQKNVEKLGRKLGIALGTAAMARYGRDAVKAFAADEAAALRLANAVDNLGLSFANPEVNSFIKNLEIQTGIIDDQLRPALQALLTTTKDLGASYQLLNDAITISRGSGIDLATVSQDLANGYVGITRGLRKYNTGLTQTQLKQKSFAEVLTILNKQFAGANQAYLASYSYKLDVLTVAAENAKETIGKGLIDAFARAGGGSEVKDAVKTIDNIAKAINGITQAVGFAIGGLTKLYKALDFITSFGGLTGANGKIVQKLAPEKVTQEVTKAAKTQIKATTALTKSNKAITAEQKKQASLKKAGTVFDLEQIQLIAALKGKLSAEERLRVEAQLALLNENDVLAQQLTKQILMAQDATGGLYKYFLAIGDAKIKNPFAFLDQWLIDFQAKLNALKFPTINPNTGALSDVSIGAQGGIGNTTISPTISSNAEIQGTFNKVLLDQLASGAGLDQAATLALSSARYAGAAQQYSQPVINVTVQGSVIREAELIDRIADATQGRSLSGSPSQIGRIQGMFSL